MDYALEKMKKEEGSFFRWMTFETKEERNDFLQKITINWYSDRAYTSTSENIKTALNFAWENEYSILFNIKWKGFSIKDVSLFEEEAEVLFSRNTYFEVDKIELDPDKNNTKFWFYRSKTAVVYLKEKSIKWINPYLYEDPRFKKAFELWDEIYIKRKSWNS